MRVNVQLFKVLMIEKNITQKEIAEHLGLNRSVINQYLAKGSIPYKHREKVKELLGEKVDLIWNPDIADKSYQIDFDQLINSGNSITDGEKELLHEQLENLRKQLKDKDEIINLLKEKLENQ